MVECMAESGDGVGAGADFSCLKGSGEAGDRS
jgi:hypothetical protein